MFRSVFLVKPNGIRQLTTEAASVKWTPKKRVSRPTMEKIRALAAGQPEQNNIVELSKSFTLSTEAIRRILKSKYVPRKEDAERQEKNRYEAMGERRKEFREKYDIPEDKEKTFWKKDRHETPSRKAGNKGTWSNDMYKKNNGSYDPRSKQDQVSYDDRKSFIPRNRDNNDETRSFNQKDDNGRPFRRNNDSRSFRQNDDSSSFRQNDNGRSFRQNNDSRSFRQNQDNKSFGQNDDGRYFRQNNESRSFGQTDERRPFRHNNDSDRPYRRNSGDVKDTFSNRQSYNRVNNEEKPFIRRNNEEKPYIRRNNEEKPYMRNSSEEKPYIRRNNDEGKESFYNKPRSYDNRRDAGERSYRRNDDQGSSFNNQRYYNTRRNTDQNSYGKDINGDKSFRSRNSEEGSDKSGKYGNRQESSYRPKN